MKVLETKLPGVVVIEANVFSDERGFFLETYHEGRYSEVGLPSLSRQDNMSYSTRSVLRGLHLQHPNPQAKLVYAPAGEIFDVAVDVRVGSPTFGRWVGEILSSDNGRQLFVPEGFAHGFCVLSEFAVVAYKCNRNYDSSSEISVLWNDPAIGIEWPVASPVLSDKDAVAHRLDELVDQRLPRWIED
jgi:dTDP-4-dehydrorhamnose 3,5-epimerase